MANTGLILTLYRYHSLKSVTLLLTVIGLKGLTGLGSPAKQLLLLRRQKSLLDFLCLEDFRR